jgi:hypothetical protein
VSERHERPTWRRRRATGMAVGVAVPAVVLTGVAWRVVQLHDAEPRFAAVSSRSAVIGTWKLENGNTGQVEFDANGRFSAAGLPVEALTLSPGGEFTGAGRWSLVDRGGAVALTPDHLPAGMNPDASLAVVRAAGRVELCVMSGSPGVLCDSLLRLAAP